MTTFFELLWWGFNVWVLIDWLDSVTSRWHPYRNLGSASVILGLTWTLNYVCYFILGD